MGWRWLGGMVVSFYFIFDVFRSVYIIFIMKQISCESNDEKSCMFLILKEFMKCHLTTIRASTRSLRLPLSLVFLFYLACDILASHSILSSFSLGDSLL